MLGLIAVVAMVGFSMAACGNSISDVTIVREPLPQVANLTVTTDTSNGDFRIIRWTATSSNVSFHEIVIRQAGGVVVQTWGGAVLGPTNDAVVDNDGTDTWTNPNRDRFVAHIDLNLLPDVDTGTNSFNIGIRANPSWGGEVDFSPSITWLPGTFARP